MVPLAEDILELVSPGWPQLCLCLWSTGIKFTILVENLLGGASQVAPQNSAHWLFEAPNSPSMAMYE